MKHLYPPPRQLSLNWKFLLLAVPLLLGVIPNTAMAQVPNVDITDPADQQSFEDGEGIGEIKGTTGTANVALSIKVTNTLNGGGESTWTRSTTSDALGNRSFNDTTIILAGPGSWEVKVWYTNNTSVTDTNTGTVNGPPE